MTTTIKTRIQLIDDVSEPSDKIIDKISGLTNNILKKFDSLSVKNLLGITATSSALNILNDAANKANELAQGVYNVGKEAYLTNANFQSMEKTLEILRGSSDEAHRLMSIMREWGRTTPLTTEDVVQSFVRLNAIGINPSKKDMETIANTAVMFQRDMADVLDGFVGLNKRTLRQLGIDIDRTGETAILVSGNVKKEVNKDSASIRKALLEIWEERFPGALAQMAETSKNKIAIMKSNFTELSASIGEELQPTIDKLVDSLGDAAYYIKNLISPDLNKQTQDATSELERVYNMIEKLRATGKNFLVLREAGKDVVYSMEYLQMRQRELRKTIALIEQQKEMDIKAKEKPVIDDSFDPFKGVSYLEGRVARYTAVLEKNKEAIKIVAEANKEIDKVDKQIQKLEESLVKLNKQIDEDKMREKWKLYTDLASSLGSTIGRSIVEGAVDMKAGFKTLLQGIADFLFTKIFLAKISAQAEAIIQGGIFNPVALSKLAVTYGSLSALKAMLTTGISKFAMGTDGPLIRPTMAIVGEQGPEQVLLPAGSQVINNRGTNFNSSPTINVYLPSGQATENTKNVVKEGVYNGLLALERAGLIQRGLVL